MAAGDEHEREAARLFGEALAVLGAARHPGRRERYRELLDASIERAERALTGADTEGAPLGLARATLVRAHAAKAEDALHGAGQLSLSAQRAPTREACDDGWARVGELVSVAEASARHAAVHAAALEQDARIAPKLVRTARSAATSADSAAQAARQLVETRNYAYTFHTDGGFSFGEGWYLAAAAVLDGVSIQIEPHPTRAEQAERFLKDAGLSGRIQPYRPRPRAMKHVTEIVGRAFRADPATAQRALRAAFLGGEPPPSEIRDFVDRRLSGASAGKKVLLWIRDGVHHPGRNTDVDELRELVRRVADVGLVPVLIGDALRDGELPKGAVDLILFWKEPLFRGPDMRRAQLHFFEHLRSAHRLIGQLGVTTAGMDGPALLGLPTLYLTDAPNVRMREWVGAVPGYEEVVREGDWLGRVTRALAEWVAAA